MNTINRLFNFLIKNFGPILGFYLINNFFGYRIAIIASLILVLVDYVLIKIRKAKTTMLFWSFNSVIVFFGIFDLILSNQFFFQYEAFLTNSITAAFWIASIFKDKSIVQEIAESQGKVDPVQTEDKRFFFNIFTVFWATYFLSKGVFYLWTYQNTDLNSAFLIRIFVGQISLWAMLAISILLPRKIWKVMESLQVFPSQKAQKSA